MNRDENMKLYEKERDAVMTQYLEDRIFSAWKTDCDADDSEYRFAAGLELILFPKCNYKCTYCYISNHGDKLYPPIEGETPELIINNLKMILQWVIDNHYRVGSLDLFSAEFFANPQWEDVLETVVSMIENNRPITRVVSIPSNMSFVMNDSIVEKISKFSRRLKRKNVDLHISGSVDGKYCDLITRPTKASIDEEHYTDIFYDKVAKFLHEFGGFHPMISASNIGAWKENLKWFFELIEKWDVNSYDSIYNEDLDKYTHRSGTPFLLEVRNNDWTHEALDQYEDFLRYAFKLFLDERFEGNLEYFASMLLKLEMKKYNTMIQHHPFSITTSGRLTCSIQNTLMVRVRYMDIVPCHRTSYSPFEYGKFRVRDNKIVGFEANNIPLMMKIYDANPIYSLPRCSSCPYNTFCTGQCLGAMYESSGELFNPINSVCRLFVRKYETLSSLYKEYDILNYARIAAEKYSDGNNEKEINFLKIDTMEEILWLIDNAKKFQ